MVRKCDSCAWRARPARAAGTLVADQNIFLRRTGNSLRNGSGPRLLALEDGSTLARTRGAERNSRRCRSWKRSRSFARWKILATSSPGRSNARPIAPRGAKVLNGMTGQRQARCSRGMTRTKKARGPRRRHPRAPRSCLRPGPVIPRQVAPRQSPTPFHQTRLVSFVIPFISLLRSPHNE